MKNTNLFKGFLLLLPLLVLLSTANSLYGSGVLGCERYADTPLPFGASNIKWKVNQFEQQVWTLITSTAPSTVPTQKESRSYKSSYQGPRREASSLMAGVLIAYTNSSGGPLIKQDVTACDGMSLNQARFIVTDEDADNMTVTLNLPPGIFYDAGTITAVTSLGGLTVAESDISDLNAPVFAITPTDLAPGNSITLQWSRSNGMTCDAYDLAIAGGTFKDGITVSTPLGVTQEVDPTVNTYNLLFASLSLAGANPITTIVGSTVSRDVIITNGGLGGLADYYFSIENGSGTSTTSLVTVPGGTVITPMSSSGTELTYSIPAAIIAEYGNNDNIFDNSEQITFRRTYTVLNCDNASSYKASWGCPDACMLTSDLPQQTNIANGVPNIAISWSTQVQQGTCTDGEYSVTYTNNGSGGVGGTAFDLDFRFATDRYSGAPFNTLSFRNLYDFMLNGNALGVTQTGSDPYAIDASNFLATDLDGAGGLDDLDGDGQFNDLAVGQSVTITLSAEYICPTSCGVTRFSTLDAVVDYEDQCEVTAQNNAGAAGITNHGSSSGTNTGPPDIQNQESFTLEVCTEHQYGGFSCPTNEMVMSFELPPGITALSGMRNGNPATLTINAAGDTASFVVSYSRVNCWELELIYDCSEGVSGDISIPYELTYSCDESCCTESWVCGDFTTNAHCPGTEPCPGVFNSNTTLERINFGWTSQDLSTPVDPTTLPSINSRRALPCDTLLFTVNGSQGGSHNNLNLSYEFGTIASNLPALNFLSGSGSIEINDASNGQMYTCQTPAPTVSTSVGLTTYQWEFSSLIGTCLPPGFVFDDGDTYVFTSNYVVVDNAGTTTTATQIPNTLAVFYNLDADGNTRLFCDDYSTEMYLFRVSTSHNFADKFNNGCTEYGAGGAFRLGNSPLGTDNFENEFRPWARIDAFEVTINTGDVYDASVTPTMRANGGVGTGGNVTINLPPPTIVGNVLRWENDGTWPFADISADPYEEYFFNYGLITSCASVSGNISTRVEYVDNFYLGEDSDCADALTYTRNQAVTLNGRPNLVTSDLTGEIQANSVQESWDLQLFNNTTLDAPYPWFALEDNPDVTILQVVDLSNNSVITPVPYADGNWYQLGGTNGDAIIGAEEAEYRIFYSTTACELQEIEVISGWDCSEYPTDPTTYVCQTNNLTLSTTGLDSEVQIQLIQEPTPPFTLCASLDYEVLLNSAQSADLDNPVAALVLPNGLQIDGNIMVEYPNGSGMIETVSTTTNGDTVFVDLESHSGIGSDGILGTVNALTASEREALILFSILTDCAFNSGGSLEILGYGDRPCGGAASNNGVRVVAEDIIVQGAEPAYLANIEFGADISPILNCTAVTVDIDMTLVSLISTMTSDKDTLIFTLDEGLKYEPGTFTNNAGLVFVRSTMNASGETLLFIAMPTPPIDLSGGAVEIMMGFGINATEDSGCDLTKRISAELVNTITGLACASEPGGVCEETRIILGDASTDALLLKPRVTFGASTSACVTSLTEVSVTGTLEVSSQDLSATDNVLVEFFCADAAGLPTGVAIGSYTLSGPITAGASVPFDVTLPSSCSTTNGIVAQIDNEQNCVCSEAMASVIIYPMPTPADAPFTLCADETATDLTANDATVLDGDAGAVTWYDGDPATTGTLINPATAVNLNNVTDLFARVTTTTGSCIADVDVTVTINPLPTPADAPFTLCADETATDLTANDNTILDGDAGAVTWYDGDPATTGTLINPATAVNLNNVTDLFARVTTTTGSCVADVDVTVTINPLPTPADAPFTLCADETATDLTANDATVLDGDAGAVTWYDGDPATTGTLINPATAVNLNDVTDLFARVTTTTGSCIADVDVTVTINSLPVVTVAEPSTICSTQSIDLTQGTGISPLSLGGFWSTPDGSGNFFEADGTTMTTAPHPFGTATTYVLSEEDAKRGSITFVLTSANPPGPCEAVSAMTTINILLVDCGTFPWDGND